MNTIRIKATMAGLFMAVSALAPVARADELDDVFARPPESAKPGVWWHWMGCNVTREGITRDLEAFKAAGIGGATLFGMADVCTPWAAHIGNSPTDGLVAFTDPWWKLVRHAAEEGRRLGLDIGMHNCPGYTHSGGPWIPPELSMQEVCWTQVTVAAGARFDGVLPRPQVDPRAHMAFPVVNKDTGVLEKPVVEARTTFYRDIAVLALPASGVVAADRVVNLTRRMQADGRLDWTAPDGEWTLLRIGHTTMGSMTQPNQWEARGLECDKMSAEANEFHLRHVLGEMRKQLGDLVGAGLNHVLFDSYEAGKPSWTPRMPQEFAARRGYDLTPFLATFAKRTIGGDAETKKFRADFDRTIADLYRDIHFPIVARRLREAGLRFTCEPYGGPWQTGEVAPHVHRVMTEFWTSPSGFRGGPQSGIFNAGDGKLHTILEAEAFTGGPENSRWTEHPDGLKPVGDGAFCAGINRLVFHGAIHQPWDDRHRPGNSMGRWGTHFGRLQTWWEPGKAWIAYLQRCLALLQWGAVATDEGVAIEAADPGLRIRSRHRTDGRTHVFFVANVERAAGAARLAFAVAGLQPEWWDPVTGEKRDLPAFRCADGKTTLTLEFAPAQSGFVVFRKEGRGTGGEGRNAPAYVPVGEIAGPWTVAFDPAWGGPEKPVAFATLEDWTKRPEPGIRHYSGTAGYRTTFDAPAAPRPPSLAPRFLSLGLVHHLAHVCLNGRDLGVVWCAPWRVEIPAGLLKAAGNELEIEITNVWANRLIGDEQEPPDCEWLPGHLPGGSYLKRFPDWFVKGTPRPSAGRRCLVTWNYFTKDSPLTPSGLLGPVRLMAADWTTPLAEPVGKPAAATPAKSSASGAAREADVPKAGLLPVASVEESDVAHTGGGRNADALFNGTTRNGEGGDATLDDGQTFRGYGDGSVLTVRLDTTRHPQGCRLEEIRTFAGHPDARAGQYYTVSIARAADPSRFETVHKVAEACPGGASLVKTPVKADGVVAVRFEFRNGPQGFCVYREICLLEPAGSIPPPGVGAGAAGEWALDRPPAVPPPARPDSKQPADPAGLAEVKMDFPIAPGPFEPTWDSIRKHYPGEPDWFREAKFGVFVHWGPQAAGRSGDWYARNLYREGHPAYTNHLRNFGHPSEVGYKEVLHAWTAPKWDPVALTRAFHDAGMRFLMVVGVHHDNYDLWDSAYQPWNSVRVGPKKDMIGGWAREARGLGMRFGITFHHEYSWWWWADAYGADTKGPKAGVPYDGALSLADGRGRWWEGLDPRLLYNIDLREYEQVAEIPFRRKGVFQDHADYAKWYAERWARRIQDAIEKYDPDMVYTDGNSAEPFSGDRSGSGFKCDAGRRVVAHFYNRALAKRGTVDTIALIKFQSGNPAVGMTSEVGVPRDIKRDQPWIGENPIGDWYYGPDYHYAAVNLVRSLLEYASRGGNYACAVPVDPEGALEPACVDMLRDMGAWMRINGAGIYGSTAWKKWGEGPGKVFSGKLSEATARIPYGTADFRFTQGRDGSVYAWCLAVPAPGAELRIVSLGRDAGVADRPVASVALLGGVAPLEWRQEPGALVIRCPAAMPFRHAVGFRVGYQP